MRMTGLGGVISCLFLLSLHGTPAKAEDLNVLTWVSSFDPDLLERWTALRHVSIRQTFFDNGMQRDLILTDPGTKIDLVALDGARATAYGRHGLLAEQDHDRPGALQQASPQQASTQQASSQEKSPQPEAARWRAMCGDYAVPYLWGTIGIVYRADKVSKPPTSWMDLLAPEPSLVGHVSMTEDDEAILVPPLIAAGRNVYTGDPADLKLAFALLQKQRPSVLTYHYILTSHSEPAFQARLYMGLGFTGDQDTLNRTSGPQKPWRYVTPEEGSVIWTDCLAVLSHAPHQARALQFLKFIDDPRNAALNSAFLRVPTANAAAISLLPEAMRNDPQIIPPAAIMARSVPRRAVPVDSLMIRHRVVSALTAVAMAPP